MNQIDKFWKEFIEYSKIDKETKYTSYYYFGLTEHLANELLRLVLIGQKKATSSSLLSYEIQKEELPKIGDYNIITDFNGCPQGIIKTTNVILIPYKDMTYDICKREGEDENLESWRRGHNKFFTMELKELGCSFDEDMIVIFEDFELVYKR